MTQSVDEFGFPIDESGAAAPAKTAVKAAPVDEFGFPIEMQTPPGAEKPFAAPTPKIPRAWPLSFADSDPGGAIPRMGQAFMEGYYGSPNLLTPEAERVVQGWGAIPTAAVHLPETALAIGSGLFRGVQQFGKELVSPINPLLARDVAAVPEAFAGSPNMLRLPEAPLRPNQPPRVPNTSAAVKAIEDPLYAEARKSNAALSADSVNKTIDSVQPTSPEDIARAQASGSDVVSGFLKRLDTFRDKPMSINTYLGLDKALTDAIQNQRETTGITPEGQQLQGIQKQLRSSFENPDASDIVSGDPTGFDYLKAGRATASQRFKMEAVERMIDIAQGRTGPMTTSMRTQIINFANNEAKSAGWTDAEIAALKDAAAGGNVDALLHTLGSKLGPAIAATLPAAVQIATTHGLPTPEAMFGGIPSYGAAYTLSSAARAGENALMNRRLQNAFNILGQGIPDNPLALPSRPPGGIGPPVPPYP